MQIIPVVDLLDGSVVRGVAGRRQEYRPVESCLCAGSDPLTICKAVRETLGLHEFYVADLDAIVHDRLNVAACRELAKEGFSTWIDAGLRDVSRAEELIDAGASAVIAGLETSSGPAHVESLCRRFGPERVVFSLDLSHGRPMGNLVGWETIDAFSIASRAVEAGVRRMIVLDVAQVGIGAGVTTLELCKRLKHDFPDLQLVTGGGVRGIEDIERLLSEGIDGVLIASAIHNGRIGRDQIQDFGNRTETPD